MNFTAKRVEPQQLGPAEQLKRRQALSTIVSTIGRFFNAEAAVSFSTIKKVNIVEAFKMKQLRQLRLSSTRQPLSTIVSTIGIVKNKKAEGYFVLIKNESCQTTATYKAITRCLLNS